ncbi:MAG: hypothetical protein R2771_15845 [Saprospiraceae bacterium]
MAKQSFGFTSYFNTNSETSGSWKDIGGSGVTHNTNWSNVDFSNVPVGNIYQFEFTSNTAHDPCLDDIDTLYVSVVECTCEGGIFLIFLICV